MQSSVAGYLFCICNICHRKLKRGVTIIKDNIGTDDDVESLLKGLSVGKQKCHRQAVSAMLLNFHEDFWRNKGRTIIYPGVGGGMEVWAGQFIF